MYGFNSILGYKKIRTELTILTFSMMPWLPLVDVLSNYTISLVDESHIEPLATPKVYSFYLQKPQHQSLR